MKSTASHYSQRAARFFTSREHLDRLLESEPFGTTDQRRIGSVAEALKLLSVRTGRNAVLKQEEGR